MTPRYFLFVLTALLTFLFIPFANTQLNAADFQNKNTQIDTINASTVVPNQLIIGVQPDTTTDELRALLAGHGVILLKHWPLFHGALVEIEGSGTQRSRINQAPDFALLEQTRQSLELLSELRYVTFNARINGMGTSNSDAISTSFSEDPPLSLIEPAPNDPEFPNQWALETIRAVEGWSITHGDPDIVVAVVDSGYDLNHPDLNSPPVWMNRAEEMGVSGIDDDGNGFVDDIRGWDFVNSNNTVNDRTGHGTHVGGVIAATTNNEIGISGIGRNIRIMPIKVLDADRGGLDGLIDALAYLANFEEVRVINLSLTLPFNSPALADAIQIIAEDKLIVAATGNLYAEFVHWPAAHPSTIAVTAIDQDQNFGAFSNRGREVSVAAPGVDILSTYPQNKYAKLPGTSMAAPHVSALAALIASLRPDFSNAQIQSIIEGSAADTNANEHPGHDQFIGHGRIDNYQALLDASVGLEIHATDLDNKHTFADYTAEYTIKVQTPATTEQASIPVQNAVVHYKLTTPDESTADDLAIISGHVLTDADGRANIRFLAPVAEGEYLLQAQVGQEIAESPLMVYRAKVDADLSIASSTMRVGSNGTQIVIEARDDAGNLIDTDLALRVAVDLGYFGASSLDDIAADDGPQVIEAVMQSGIYSTTLYAGTTAGVATIRASVAGAVPVQSDVRITAGDAATIELLSNVTELQSGQNETSTAFTILVKDVYGNLVDTPFAVKLYSSTGEIAPLLHHAAGDDPLTAALTLPAGVNERIMIWAILEDTQLITNYTIEVVRGQRSMILLPFVSAGR